jgi:hypothetical protein
MKIGGTRKWLHRFQPQVVRALASLSTPKLVDCPTLGEAVLAFDRLPEGDREQATIKVNAPGGATHMAEEIDRLHVAPKKRKDARRGAAHHG